jgi:hypothetical protein
MLKEVLLKQVSSEEGFVEEGSVEGGSNEGDSNEGGSNEECPDEVLVESTKAAAAGTTTTVLPLGTWMSIVQYIARSRWNCMEACWRERGSFLLDFHWRMRAMVAR